MDISLCLIRKVGEEQGEGSKWGKRARVRGPMGLIRKDFWEKGSKRAVGALKTTTIGTTVEASIKTRKTSIQGEGRPTWLAGAAKGLCARSKGRYPQGKHHMERGRGRITGRNGNSKEGARAKREKKTSVMILGNSIDSK